MKASSGGNETKVPFYRLRRFVLVLALVVVIASTLAVTSYTFHFFNNGTIGCGSSMPVSTRFTVIIDYVIRRPLPTINTTQGQTITIHAWNNGTVPHGFAIQHYFDQGTNLQPGQSCDLTFSASQPGAFEIYSNEPDPWFSLAQLNVNPSTQNYLGFESRETLVGPGPPGEISPHTRFFTSTGFSHIVEKSATVDFRVFSKATEGSEYQFWTPRNQVVGDWQTSRVYGALGEPMLSLQFAKSSLEITAKNKLFDIYSNAHEAIARAHAVAGNKKLAKDHLNTARKMLDSMTIYYDDDDRKIYLSQILETEKMINMHTH